MVLVNLLVSRFGLVSLWLLCLMFALVLLCVTMLLRVWLVILRLVGFRFVCCYSAVLGFGLRRWVLFTFVVGSGVLVFIVVFGGCCFVDLVWFVGCCFDFGLVVCLCYRLVAYVGVPI